MSPTLEHVGDVLDNISDLDTNILVVMLLVVPVELDCMTNGLDGVPSNSSFNEITVYELLDSLFHQWDNVSNRFSLGFVDQSVGCLFISPVEPT